jgi:predicted house-cleaning noncanonical NTP pyrophosphatase (MazG superfamily)
MGLVKKKIEEMRLAKKEKRGGFNKKLFLIEVDD